MELGSGIGELLRLIPSEYAQKLIGIDQSIESLKVLKSQHPESSVAVGDILSLPVASNSVDTVISFSVLDTILNLDKAIEESNRVLNQNGKFIHFLDLQPHGGPLIDTLPRGFIPFPNIADAIPGEKLKASDGFQLVSVDDYIKLRNSIHPMKRMLFDIFLKDPKGIYNALYNSSPDIILDITNEVRQSGLVKEKITSFKELFNRNLNSELTNNGLEIVEQGDRTASLVIDKTDQARAKGDYNYFHNDVGLLHSFKRNDLNLGPNQMQTKSTLSVTVANKKG